MTDPIRATAQSTAPHTSSLASRIHISRAKKRGHTPSLPRSIWDKHASPTGIAFLMLGLSAAYCYQEAPLRPRVEPGAAPVGKKKAD